jgi:predicted metallopeptidase
MEESTINLEQKTIDELFRRSKQYRGSDEFFKFLKFVSKFPHYSRFNNMLVYLQDETVTLYGGVGFWKRKFNRTVRESARPYVILQPFAPVMMVYDVFETEGMETPDEFLKNGIGKELFEVNGYINPQILDDTIKIASEWGIKVYFKPLSFFNAGYITTIFKQKLEIALKEGLSYEQNMAVLIHELAHLFLGHTGHKMLRKQDVKKPIQLLHRKLSNSAEELEAETISYLICKKLGLSTKSEEYLADYINSDKDLREFSYETVIRVSDRIEELFLKRWTKTRI